MDTRTQTVVLETARHRIVGELTMPREGYRSRISDFFNRSDLKFVPLSNVELFELDGAADQDPIERDFIAVAVDHVQLAYPSGE